jgi:hypothetical protein
MLIERLAGLRPNKFETQEVAMQRKAKVGRYERDRCVRVDVSSVSARALKRSHETLFVNASLEAEDGNLTQIPFLVTLDLPQA